MTTAKVLGVVVFSVLLTVSVVTASTAIAVDRTVLNTNHVSETLQENGVYATVTAEARQEASGQLDDELSAQQANIPDGIDLDIDPQEVMKTTITEEYLAGEFKRNVATGLAFFKGNTDEIDVQINLQPALNRLSDQFNSSVVTVDTVALAQQRDIQESAAGVTVDNDMIARLNADAGGYESVRRQIRVQAIEHRDLPLKIDEDDPDSVVVETVTLVRETDFTDLQTSVPVSKELLVTMNENASAIRRHG
ncbi:hypothetical protein [Halovenus salina]|uniref:Uncharacterized protein n=1 Tax=Halovenus salina TaxID=1510225 RepID=A0ABD5W0Y8_9EURY